VAVGLESAADEDGVGEIPLDFFRGRGRFVPAAAGGQLGDARVPAVQVRGLVVLLGEWTSSTPAARLPMVNVQIVPAGAPSAQPQPALLAAALKVVLAGTVSLITTPAAWLGPEFV
jgi:hypothetical protein